MEEGVRQSAFPQKIKYLRENKTKQNKIEKPTRKKVKKAAKINNKEIN